MTHVCLCAPLVSYNCESCDFSSLVSALAVSASGLLMVAYATMVQAVWRATYRVIVRWSKRQNPAIAVGGKVTLCVGFLLFDLPSLLSYCETSRVACRQIFGSQSRDCPDSQNSSGGFGSGGGSSTECYRCGKVGHIARACPEAPGGGSGGYGGGGGGGYGSFGGGGGGGGGSQKTWCALAVSCRLVSGC